MNLQKLIEDLNFKGIKNYKDLEIESLTNISTDQNPNGIYFCLKGGRVDGHDFAKEAIENGAECLVVERFLDLPVTQILVDNSRRAMTNISAKFYEMEKSNIKFVGITGTNGKTTTTFITRAILQQLGHRVGMIGTEGIYIGDIKLPSNMTTPDPIKLHKIIHDMDMDGIEYVVMEVSAHALALNKVDEINYDVACLSNITQDHLDYFATMENYARAKAEFFTPSRAKSAIINIDDKFTRAIYRKTEIPVKTLSIKKDADICIDQYNCNTDGTQAVMNFNNTQYMLNTNLIGEYNLSNALMAISACAELGFNINDVVQAFNSCEINVPGRLNIIPTNKKASVVVDFAHTPDGMEKVLNTLNKLKQGRLIVVFGCGGNRDNLKRAQMGEISTKLADFVVVTSDNPRFENPQQIISDIEKGVNQNKSISIVDRVDAINYALSVAREGDIVAILGKGAESYQEVNGVKHDFSDYKAVEEFFGL